MEIRGDKPLSSEQYKQAFDEGAKIVKESSKLYNESPLDPQSEQLSLQRKKLKQAMDEAMKAMNQIISNVLHKEGESLQQKLKDDYAEFRSNPTQTAMDQLNRDIQNTKKFL